MKEWVAPGDRPDPRRKYLVPAAGIGICLLALLWWRSARVEEEPLPSSGFQVNGGGPARTPAHEKRDQTGLALVYRGQILRDESGAETPAESPAPTTPLPPAPADAAPAPPDALSADAAGLARAGIRSDAAGLTQLGLKDELMIGAVRKLLEHPRVLGYLLNDKTLVDAFFSRDDVREKCASAAAQKAWLADASKPDGVSAWLGLVQEAVRHQESAVVGLSSELGKRMMECPSSKQLANDPGSLMQIAGSNPGIMGLLTDPVSTKALSSDPRAAALLKGATSSLGGFPAR